MGKSLPPRVIRSGKYLPTLPRTGDEDGSIFRKNNLITRGREGRYYERVYSGEADLNENVNLVPLTGTLSLSQGSTTIFGVGTLLNSECHLGQFILVIDDATGRSWLLVVRRVVSDTQMVVWKAPDTAISGLTGWRMPVLWAINDTRGTALRGNVIKLDKGSYLGVGDGTFRVNGQSLAGSPMALSRRPKLALFDPLTATYTVFTLGMDTPAAPTLAAVGGGTKGMQAGSYTMVITPARKETVGYNNPSVRSNTVTIATGGMVATTFPAMDTVNGQNAWIVWVTTFEASLGSNLNLLEGPWFRYVLLDDTQVSPAGGVVNLEWLDTEVENNEIVTFNNDAPTDAEFVELLNAIPVYISCQGQGYDLHPEATSPGPFICPAKPNNIEAAPLDVAFSSSPPETILGAVSAQGRIYLLTINHLQIAQATPSDTVPVLIRPFWKDGFANPYQLVFVNGNLYGYPTAGPSRSVGDGDEIVAERDWAADVYEIIQHWNPGQVLVGYDPENDIVVFIHSADALNDAGFWTTRMLGYGIPQGFWVFDRRMTSDTQDMIVSGVATIGDRMELLLGGRGVVGSESQRLMTEDFNFIMTEDLDYIVWQP